MSIRPSSEQAKLLQGTLDLLILKALALGELHGLGVSRRIEQITNGTFQVKPGSLFPALHRMEEAGWLVAKWGESESNRRAKYYRAHRGRATPVRDRDRRLESHHARHLDGAAHDLIHPPRAGCGVRRSGRARGARRSPTLPRQTPPAKTETPHSARRTRPLAPSARI